MNKLLLLLTMLFCHIVDDYYLQGILASMKQKSWWQEHYPNKMYKYDYIVALIEHTFSWTFMIMLPIIVYSYLLNKNIEALSFLIIFITNTIWHAYIDNLKANKKEISLVTDQSIHFFQIFITWLSYITLLR